MKVKYEELQVGDVFKYEGSVGPCFVKVEELLNCLNRDLKPIKIVLVDAYYENGNHERFAINHKEAESGVYEIIYRENPVPLKPINLPEGE